jgi:amino acid transporter
VASAFVIGLVVPFNDPQLLGGTGDASSSPFVIAINRSKIKVLPDLINAVVLVSAYSATSSEVCK